MKKFTPLLSLLMAGTLFSAAAENLLFNSSFELGSKGYSCYNSMLIDSGVLDFADLGMAVDTGVSKYGRNSLRVTSTAIQATNIVSHEIEIAPGKKHTLSFWGRSDTDKRPLDINFNARIRDGKDVKTDSKAGRFVLGKDWKRYSFSFIPGGAGRHYLFRLQASSEFPGDCWLDGVQLEEGEMTDYHPAAALETAVYTPEKIIGTDKVKGWLRTISYDQTLTGQSVELALVDGSFQRRIAAQVLRLDLPAGEAVTQDFSFAGARFGGMTVIPDHGVQASSAFLVRLHTQPERRPGGFQLGCNGNILGRNGRTPGSKGAAFLNIMGNDSLASYRPLLGGSARIWGTDFNWRYIEPEPGKFVWDRVDRVVSEAERNHLEMEFTLTGNFCSEIPGAGNLPDWVRQRDSSGNPEGVILPPCCHKTSLPRLEDWRGYVRAIATRYKGRIAYYDIINEPNSGMPPATYLEYLKAAYEEIKKADPAAKVVGLSATEDIGGRAAEFLADTLRLGGGNYLDVISFHPYGSRMDDSAVPAMKRICQLRQIARDASVDKPLWNDESFYLNSVPQGHYLLEGQIPVGAVSRRLLIDMGEGLGASTPLSIDQLFKDPMNPQRLRQTWDQKVQPSEIFAEQNAAATFLSGAVPLRTLELPGDIQCYLFKNGDKLYAALWTRSQEKLFMTLKAPNSDSSKFLAFLWPWASDKANISVYDLFGNQTQEDAPEVQLEIGRLPQYLEWNGCDAEAAARALENAPIRFENDFKVNLARVFGGEVAVSFTNTSVDTVNTAEVEVESPSFEAPGTAQAAKPVESLKTAVVNVPVKLKPDAPETVDLKIRVSGAGKSFEREMSAHVATVIDLMEGRPSAALPIAKTVVGKAASAADLSASFTAAYDAAGDLLLNVQVQDDAKGKPANSPFEEDCIEIFLDAFPLRTETQPYAYQDSTYQITVAPWREKGKQVSSKIAKVTADIKPRPDGYDAEIRVPLRGIVGPLPGKLVGFDIAIDDSDTDKRKTQLVWNGTGSNYKDRSLFGALKFQATSKARIDIDGQSPRLDMKCGASSRNVKLGDAAWLGDAKSSRLIAVVPVYPEWAESSFSFTPQQTGTLRLELMGEYAPDAKDRAWCEYDALVVTGAMLLDGEKLGKSPVKANHDQRIVQKLAVEAGKPVKISFAARAAALPKKEGSRP